MDVARELVPSAVHDRARRGAPPHVGEVAQPLDVARVELRRAEVMPVGRQPGEGMERLEAGFEDLSKFGHRPAAQPSGFAARLVRHVDARIAGAGDAADVVVGEVPGRGDAAQHRLGVRARILELALNE